MKAGGVGKSALTGMSYIAQNNLLNGQFPVRFIRDVFVENYDPTIEGLWLVVTWYLLFDWPCRGISKNYYSGWSVGFRGYLFPWTPGTRPDKWLTLIHLSSPISFVRAARSFGHSRSGTIHISQRGLHKGCNLV
jgi:hypothetical protein